GGGGAGGCVGEGGRRGRLPVRPGRTPAFRARGGRGRRVRTPTTRCAPACIRNAGVLAGWTGGVPPPSLVIYWDYHADDYGQAGQEKGRADRALGATRQNAEVRCHSCSDRSGRTNRDRRRSDRVDQSL